MSRKRARNTSEWIDVKAKRLLNSRLEHINRNNQKKEGKKIGPPCSVNCRMKCRDKLTEEDRKLLFELYWGLGEHTRQWDLSLKTLKYL